MRTEISQSDGSVFDSVLLQVAFDRFEQECCYSFLDQLVSEALVKAQVGEVAAPLPVMLNILSVFKHVYHEVNSIVCSNLVVAVENLCNMRKRCGCIKCCF